MKTPCIFLKPVSFISVKLLTTGITEKTRRFVTLKIYKIVVPSMSITSPSGPMQSVLFLPKLPPRLQRNDYFLFFSSSVRIDFEGQAKKKIDFVPSIFATIGSVEVASPNSRPLFDFLR